MYCVVLQNNEGKRDNACSYVLYATKQKTKKKYIFEELLASGKLKLISQVGRDTRGKQYRKETGKTTYDNNRAFYKVVEKKTSQCHFIRIKLLKKILCIWVEKSTELCFALMSQTSLCPYNCLYSRKFKVRHVSINFCFCYSHPSVSLLFCGEFWLKKIK